MKTTPLTTQRLRRVFALLALPVLTASLNAQALMLDFGTTTVAAPELTNSPYHSANSNFTGSTWNRQFLSSNDSSLLWSDGTTATGVSFNVLKSGGNGSLVMVKGTAGGAGPTGTAVNTGIYAGTSVGADGQAWNTTITDNRAVGIQVFGLALGTYEIYVSGRNTDYATTAYNMNFYAGASVETTATATSGGGSSGTKLNLASGFVQETNNFANATDKTDSWTFVAGDSIASNYAKLTVTITSENPLLNIVALGDSGSAMSQGILNSIQIVSVIPESSAFALLAGLGGLLLAASRRHRRAA